MAKIFEDELMDLQADYVSLCMEAMEGIADEIFIYISNEATCHMFHTFCRVKGQVKTINQLFSPLLQRDLLMTGGEISKRSTRSASVMACLFLPRSNFTIG